MDPPKTWKIELGRRIRQARQEAGLSQSQLGKHVTLGKAMVSHWELGRNEITSFDAIIVARVLRVDLGWLMTGVPTGTGADLQIQPEGDRLIPRITHPQALEIAKGNLNLHDITERLSTGFGLVTPERCFAILAPDPIAMTRPRTRPPKFKLNPNLKLWLVIDPAKFSGPCETLVALLATNELLYRRIELDEDQSAEPPYVLTPDNPLFEPRRITRDHQPVMMGRVIQWNKIYTTCSPAVRATELADR